MTPIARARLAVLVFVAVGAAAPRPAHALTGELPPKNTLILDIAFTYRIANQFFLNNYGFQTQNIVGQYNNIRLTPDLLLGEAGLASLAGVTQNDTPEQRARKLNDVNLRYFLGSTAFSLQAFTRELKLTMAYAITDTMAVGFIMPMVWATYNIRFRLVGARVRLTDPAAPIPVAPLDGGPGGGGLYGPYEGLTGEDINAYLSSPSGPYQYQPLPVGDNTVFGVGDTRVGMFNRLWTGENFETTLINFVTLPTGRFTPQNAIYGQKFGDGQWDIGALVANDWFPIGRSPDIGGVIRNLMFSLTTGYTYQIPDQRNMRVWSAIRAPDGRITAALPLTTKDNFRYVRRDYGDTFEFWLSGNLGITSYASIGFIAYTYYQHADVYTGPDAGRLYQPGNGAPARPDPGCRSDTNPNGVPCQSYGAFEFRTTRSAVEFTGYINFNTIPLALRGKFIPMLAGIAYGQSILGMNIDSTQWVSANITLIAPFDAIFGSETPNIPEQAPVRAPGKVIQRDDPLMPTPDRLRADLGVPTFGARMWR